MSHDGDTTKALLYPDRFDATTRALVTCVALGVAPASGEGDMGATHVAVLLVPRLGLARPLYFGSAELCDRVCELAPSEVDVNAERFFAETTTVTLRAWQELREIHKP